MTTKIFKKMFHDLNSLCLVSWGCVDINELLIYTSELGFRWYCTHQQNTGTCQTQILKNLLQKPALKLLFISSINMSNNHTDQYWLNIIINALFQTMLQFFDWPKNFICSPCTQCLHSGSEWKDDGYADLPWNLLLRKDISIKSEIFTSRILWTFSK